MQRVWDEVQKLTAKAVTEIQIPVNDTKVLEYVIEKGLASLTVADVRAVKTDC